jgi:hypothetical protein
MSNLLKTDEDKLDGTPEKALSDLKTYRYKLVGLPPKASPCCKGTVNGQCQSTQPEDNMQYSHESLRPRMQGQV